MVISSGENPNNEKACIRSSGLSTQGIHGVKEALELYKND